jgi:hypothetical protein
LGLARAPLNPARVTAAFRYEKFAPSNKVMMVGRVDGVVTIGVATGKSLLQENKKIVPASSPSNFVFMVNINGFILKSFIF